MYTHENKALPTWTDKGKVMYHVPRELSNLSIAEYLLIQRVSPLIPVIHIKNGILGSRGHIVSFFQDMTSIATDLPGLPNEVTIVKVIREGINKEGLSCRNNFQVNRIKVLNALRWLQKNNVLYKDIVIDESRLSLMKNQTTCQLKNMNIVTTKDDNISKWNDR